MKESVHPESIRKASDLSRFSKMENMFMRPARRERAACKERCLCMIEHGMLNELQIIWQERYNRWDVSGGNSRKRGYSTRSGWRGQRRPDQGKYRRAVLRTRPTSHLEYI